jgi:cytochrome c oxidase assembly protein subunit 11
MKGQDSKNRRLLTLLAVFVALMIGVAYASVPLYTLFCRATGFGGTPQRTEKPLEVSKTVEDRYVTVTFDGNVDSALPWDFGPDVKSVRVKLGEETTVKYHAHNRSTKTLTGTATYNVQPDKAGAYFDKIQCFCFTKQILKPRETAELAVPFYLDPSMADEKDYDEIKNITLSYTFFLAKDQDKARTAQQDLDRYSNKPSNP